MQKIRYLRIRNGNNQQLSKQNFTAKSRELLTWPKLAHLQRRQFCTLTHHPMYCHLLLRFCLTDIFLLWSLMMGFLCKHSWATWLKPQLYCPITWLHSLPLTDAWTATSSSSLICFAPDSASEEPVRIEKWRLSLLRQ